ncbi:MAG: efflux RND transporter periplasmic adaptor subunit [Pseudobdellovibrionaceae bacterium]|jgi:macrolide-specific efflux system membrane fusion protein|nr:efflux RND transporter periplasmic adaptor subunit [Pseudobdellovibrionaceae bacterium]
MSCHKTPPKKVIALLILALIAGGGAYAYQGVSSDFSAHADTAPVQTAIAQTGNILTQVTSQGTLEPKDYVDVGAQISGQILKLHVDIGNQVRAGDLIAEIDPKIYESQISSDEAQLAMLQAQLSEKQANKVQAQRNYTRYKKLVTNNAVSRDMFEQSETDLNVADAQIKSLEAQIKQSESTLEKDTTNLSYTKIYAPISGTVVDLSVKEGETVNANQTTPTIGRIANLDVMTAKAQVAEADIPKLKNDMRVYFTTLGSDARKWDGKIRQILPTPTTENNVVLYDVLVDVDNKDRSLMTGMTTQMFFIIGETKDAVLIPVSALVERVPEQDTETGSAYRIKQPSLANQTYGEEKIILVGLTDRVNAEVLSGLNVGDPVLIPTAVTSDSTQSTRMRMPRL